MAADTNEHRPFAIPSKTYGFPPQDFDPSLIPDFDTTFLPPEDVEAFVQALAAPDALQPAEDGARSPSLLTLNSFDFGLTKRNSMVAEDKEKEKEKDKDSPQAVAAQATQAAAAAEGKPTSSLFISAKNDWAPVHEKVLRSPRRASRRQQQAAAVRRRRAGRPGRRSKDETREGYSYRLLKWPFLIGVCAWIVGLAIAYMVTRVYIALYEQCVTWRGQRERLRRAMRTTSRYPDWVAAARDLDDFLGNSRWKEENEFAYYDSKTVRRVWDQLRKCRLRAEAVEKEIAGSNGGGTAEASKATRDLKALIEACVKNNFVGVENSRLYSQTYYGTKNLVQNFVDEVERCLQFLISTNQLDMSEKRALFKRLRANYGRTALCLSGGATFAFYHFGVVKALLDEDLLPDVITGTSGGALVAALVATRTNDELKKLLVPALAYHITACSEPLSVWVRRWWKTGARFDSIEWAKKCSWFTRGSMTFREAYERTGRVLNVSCVPSDPHSPTILCNYLTSPDCVIWSAVLASAAVPGILNPVVLMMKTPEGNLVPYSFGHKWKDGSLRTDIPIKSLNMHFNVNFTIVSQVNPHINLFFFSSRGAVGQPVTHRKGRGWRGGYLGSALEQYLKLDLTKWLKVLRHLELLPRPLGQDWSQIFLQDFGGTITIWPKTVPSDFWHILTDPDPARLARMIHEGQQSMFPRLKFVSNRLRIERLVERGRLETRPSLRRGSIEAVISEDDLRGLLRDAATAPSLSSATVTTSEDDFDQDDVEGETSPGEEDLHLLGRSRRAVAVEDLVNGNGSGSGGSEQAAVSEETVEDEEGDGEADADEAVGLGIKKTE